jgi:hypothetical protein
VGFPVATRSPARRTWGRTKQDVVVSTSSVTVPVEPNADAAQLRTTDVPGS